jgi:hypothetical protein
VKFLCIQTIWFFFFKFWDLGAWSSYVKNSYVVVLIEDNLRKKWLDQPMRNYLVPEICKNVFY